MFPIFGRRKASSIAGGGRVGASLATLLNSHSPGTADTRSPAEWIADILARTTGVGIEQSAHRKIQRRRNQLTSAVGVHHRRTSALAQFAAHTRSAERELRAQTHHEHQKDNLANRMNAAVPLISGPFLLLLETVVLIAEITFYYYIFSNDMQQDPALLEKTMVAVLSMLVPISGIATARWFASSVCTIRGMSSCSNRTRSPLAYTAFVAAAAVLVVVCVATFKLVGWRYDGQLIPGLSDNQPPATVMATIFVVTLLLDAGIRSFAAPFSARSDGFLARSIRTDQRRHTRLVNQQNKAVTDWTKAWTNLETTLNALLADCERALSTADINMLAARTGVATSNDQKRALIEPALGREWEGVRLAPRLGLPHIDIKFRIIDAAFQQLARDIPPAHGPASTFDTTQTGHIGADRPRTMHAPDEAA